MCIQGKPLSFAESFVPSRLSSFRVSAMKLIVLRVEPETLLQGSLGQVVVIIEIHVVSVRGDALERLAALDDSPKTGGSLSLQLLI